MRTTRNELHQILPLPLRVARPRATRPKTAWVPYPRYAHFEPLPRDDRKTRSAAWLVLLFVASYFFFGQLFGMQIGAPPPF